MFGFETIDLKDKKDNKFYYNNKTISKKTKEIDSILESHRYLNKYSEPKRELKEGIIGEDSNQTRLNQTNAYNYILGNKNINEKNLNTLYGILSTNQLDEYSEIEKGKLYRQKNVYILDSYHPELSTFGMEFDTGIKPQKVPEHMHKLFDFINNKNIDPAIKAQIIHFYFVYVHPYYDVNGRTARNLSSWYLINNDSNPYTILNRGLANNKERYLSSIKKSRHGNLTHFIDTSLSIVSDELKLQVFINKIKRKYYLNNEECETLELILKTNHKSISRIHDTFFYQKGIHNREVISKKILQLLEKNVVSYNKETKEIIIPDMIERKKFYRKK